MSASTERKNRQAAREAGLDKKAQAAKEAAEKSRKNKRKWTIGTIAVILCIALVVFLSSAAFNRTITAVSVGNRSLSVAETNYIVGNIKSGMNYDMYAAYVGQDYADQLLKDTLEHELLQSTALLQYAKENNISLTAAEKAGVGESVDEMMDQVAEIAKQNGISSSTYLTYVFGKGVNSRLIRSGMEENLLVNKAYFAKFCEVKFSPEELEAYFEDPADGEVFTYAYYLIPADENRTMDEAKAAAQDIMISYNDNKGADPDALTVLDDILAEEFDGDSATLVSVAGPQLDETFAPWLKGEARAEGDLMPMETSDGSGWYVVLYLGREENLEPTVAVRHILIKAEASEDGSFTDEAKDAARAKAEEILAGWEAGDKTEASFAALAYLYSEDNGSRASGGLYSSVTQGQMMPEFDAFCFEDHQYGDTAIVYAERGDYAGYHIMFFVERSTAREAAARDALRTDAMNEWIESLTEGLEVEYHWAYKFVG